MAKVPCVNIDFTTSHSECQAETLLGSTSGGFNHKLTGNVLQEEYLSLPYIRHTLSVKLNRSVCLSVRRLACRAQTLGRETPSGENCLPLQTIYTQTYTTHQREGNTPKKHDRASLITAVSLHDNSEVTSNPFFGACDHMLVFRPILPTSWEYLNCCCTFPLYVIQFNPLSIYSSLQSSHPSLVQASQKRCLPCS